MNSFKCERNSSFLICFCCCFYFECLQFFFSIAKTHRVHIFYVLFTDSFNQIWIAKLWWCKWLRIFQLWSQMCFLAQSVHSFFSNSSDFFIMGLIDNHYDDYQRQQPFSTLWFRSLIDDGSQLEMAYRLQLNNLFFLCQSRKLIIFAASNMRWKYSFYIILYFIHWWLTLTLFFFCSFKMPFFHT